MPDLAHAMPHDPQHSILITMNWGSWGTTGSTYVGRSDYRINWEQDDPISLHRQVILASVVQFIHDSSF